jgi:lysophospholipase L1-like esterase
MPAIEFQPRSGLPNLMRKLRRKGTVRIAYLGGSITQDGAGWRVQTAEWLQKAYPTATLQPIAAAIGGTGSDLGVFRLEKDVLVHRPDLVFVEFSINDRPLDVRSSRRAMEGIVRKIRRRLPECDICFVYTVAVELMADLQAGRFPLMVCVHEQVARHYDIPSIAMGLEVARAEAEGRLIFTAAGEEKERFEKEGKIVFAQDTCHAYPAGHRFYTEAVQRAFVALDKQPGTPGSHPLPAPLDPANWEEAEMLPIMMSQAVGGCREIARSAWPAIAWSVEAWDSLWKADPGAGLEVRFRGTGLGVFDVIGPDSGCVDIVVDGRARPSVDRFDLYCDCFRRHAFMVADSLPDGEHVIRLTLSPKAPDKIAIMKGAWDAVTVARHPNLVWYPAALLVLGRIPQG